MTRLEELIQANDDQVRRLRDIDEAARGAQYQVNLAREEFERKSTELNRLVVLRKHNADGLRGIVRAIDQERRRVRDAARGGSYPPPV